MSALTILMNGEQDEERAGLGPMVQIVLPDGQREFPFSELALPGDDPSTIADDTLKLRAERWLDLVSGTLDRNYKVGRPSTGNIMIQRVGVYGESILCACGHSIIYHVKVSCSLCDCQRFVRED